MPVCFAFMLCCFRDNNSTSGTFSDINKEHFQFDKHTTSHVECMKFTLCTTGRFLISSMTRDSVSNFCASILVFSKKSGYAPKIKFPR